MIKFILNKNGLIIFKHNIHVISHFFRVYICLYFSIRFTERFAEYFYVKRDFSFVSIQIITGPSMRSYQIMWNKCSVL